MAILGVDLGTTNSLGVMAINGNVQLIPNLSGSYMTPSAVRLAKEGIQVGYPARMQKDTVPGSVAVQFKRMMGTDEKIRLSGRKFAPVELSSFVLASLVKDAETFSGEKITELVISVPAYFDEKQRRATRQAGERLGIPVTRLINEPSAAAIALRKDREMETVVICDFGGGTLDVSVVDSFENVISIVAIAGDNHLGGMDIDLLIAREFAGQLDADWNSLGEEDQNRLLSIAEQAKIRLGSKERVELPFTFHGTSKNLHLSSMEMDRILKPVIARIRQVISKAVSDSGLAFDEIDRLALVGGSSHLQALRSALAASLKIPMEASEEADCLVAEGLGEYLAMMERTSQNKELVVMDICPFSLSASVLSDYPGADHESLFLIERNTVLPAEAVHRVVCHAKGQKAVRLQIAQGESKIFEKNRMIGILEYTFPFHVGRNEKVSIDIVCHYDLDSFLEIELFFPEKDFSCRFILSEEGRFVPKKESGPAALTGKEAEYDRIVRDPARQLEARASEMIHLLSGEEREALFEAAGFFKNELKKAKTARRREQLFHDFRELLDGFEKRLHSSSLFFEESGEQPESEDEFDAGGFCA